MLLAFNGYKLDKYPARESPAQQRIPTQTANSSPIKESGRGEKSYGFSTLLRGQDCPLTPKTSEMGVKKLAVAARRGDEHSFPRQTNSVNLFICLWPP